MKSDEIADALLEADEPVDPKDYIMTRLPRRTMTVILKSVGNPDFGEFFGEGVLSPTRKVKVKSYAEAARVCRQYISDHRLGGGNWGRFGGDGSDNTPKSGTIIVNGKKAAYVSYNGRVWDAYQNEILVDE